MELKRFFIEKYLNKQKWQNCILSIYLWHIEDKK